MSCGAASPVRDRSPAHCTTSATGTVSGNLGELSLVDPWTDCPPLGQQPAERRVSSGGSPRRRRVGTPPATAPACRGGGASTSAEQEVAQMTTVLNSRISGFHKMSPTDRLATVRGWRTSTRPTVAQLRKPGNLDAEVADHMIENVVSSISIPIGIATNVKVDGRDVLVPMATEESSVVAAVCNSARQCYDAGGFTTSVSGMLMIAQVQLVERQRPAGGADQDPREARRDRGHLRRLRPHAGRARRRLPRPRGPRDRRRGRPDGGHPHHRRHARRDGGERGQHHGGAARALHRGLDGRQGLPAHPVEPRGPPRGTGPRDLAARRHRRPGRPRRHDLGLPLRGRRPLSRRDAQQGHHERRVGRRARHRQRHPRGGGRRPRLRGRGAAATPA